MREMSCVGCKAKVPAGTRFCTQCGTPVRGLAGGDGVAARPATAPSATHGMGRAGWWVSGGLVLALVAVLAYAARTDPATGGAGGAGTGAVPPGMLGVAPNIDLNSMTAREAADALFNRVMRAVAQDNLQEANNFLPMALDAYELARPLDADGLFHLSLLQRASQRFEASLATALEGLEGNPEHLLNLSAAAEASLALGDSAAAVDYYRRMLTAWDRERAELRVEYEEHGPLLPLLREDAELLLGASTP